ncbi:MAG: hypothetical protein ACOYBY_01530 [Dermatophilaceae bacterium]
MTTQREVVSPELAWRRLYLTGGVSGLVYLLLVLVPLVLLVATPVPPESGAALLTYVDEHKASYLVELVCFVGLAVPGLVVFAALAVALRTVDLSIAALGGLVGVVSETIALALGSSPQSLHGGLVVLANQYAHADSDAGRAGLASAADALAAATNAVSWAGILTAAAILLLSLLLRRRGFGMSLAVLGVITGAIGVVSEALRPVIGPGYLLYGLLLPTWFGWVGWKLLRSAH